jgi:biopolymer transport protein ExbB/TolQ
MEAREASWIAAMWTGVALVVLGPLVGIGGTVLGMRRSFEVIERMKAPTPEQLAGGVHDSMAFTLLGCAIAAAGVVLAVVAFVRLQRLREARAAIAIEQESWR